MTRDIRYGRPTATSSPRGVAYWLLSRRKEPATAGLQAPTAPAQKGPISAQTPGQQTRQSAARNRPRGARLGIESQPVTSPGRRQRANSRRYGADLSRLARLSIARRAGSSVLSGRVG